jgi:putative membrane protein
MRALIGRLAKEICMRLTNLFICSTLCTAGLWAQTPRSGQIDPHESPVSAVNADENSKLPPSSKPTSNKQAQKSKAAATALAKTSGTNAQDRAFLMTAAKAGREEVRSAQTMADQSSNPEVKAFAQKLVTDHTPANQELETWAQQKGVDLPADTSSATNTRPMADKKYMASEIANHQKAIQLFEKEATTGLNRDLRGFAVNMLPSLQQHLKMAKSIQNGGSPLRKNSDNNSTTGSNVNHSNAIPATSSTPSTTPPTTTSTYTPKVAHPANSGSKSGDKPAR